MASKGQNVRREIVKYAIVIVRGYDDRQRVLSHKRKVSNCQARNSSVIQNRK